MTESLDDRTYELLFSIRRSVRYHMHRRRFYELWNSTTVTLGVLGGSSAVTAFALEAGSWMPALFAGIVAIASALDLAVGTARCGDLHGELARRFIVLEQRFAHGRDLDDAEHEDLVRARLDIEAAEPTVLRLLDVTCHFEVLRSLGDATAHPAIPWWRRKAMHWMSQAAYAQRLAQERATSGVAS